ITSKANVNYMNLARKKIAEIGYTDAVNGFCSNSASVSTAALPAAGNRAAPSTSARKRDFIIFSLLVRAYSAGVAEGFGG
ncbi:MAG: hypothetical protein AAF415_13475, partial [Pseudomonadota bacterium]